jgi:DNA-binding FadR family transcriptional regulator
MSGNRVLSLFGGSLKYLFRERVHSSVYAVEERQRVIHDHGKIGQAILAGNAGRAKKLMHQHMDDVNSSLRRLYPGIGSDVMDWE